MIDGKFSMQIHHGKRPGPGVHWDFRLLIPNEKRILSWSIPKRTLPTRGKRNLAVWVDDTHPMSHMTFEGRLKNGDLVELYDVGDVKIHRMTKDKLIFDLHGSKIKGSYVLIKTNDKNWLIIGKS